VREDTRRRGRDNGSILATMRGFGRLGMAPTKSWISFDSQMGEDKDDPFALFESSETRAETQQKMTPMQAKDCQIVPAKGTGFAAATRVSMAKDDFLEFLVGDDKRAATKSMWRNRDKWFGRLLRR